MINGPAPAPKTLTEIAVGMESQLEEEADSAYFLEILAGSLMSNSSSGGRFYQSSKATADKTRLAISLSAHSDEMLDEMIVAATLTQIGSAASIDSILEDSDSVLELAEQLTSKCVFFFAYDCRANKSAQLQHFLLGWRHCQRGRHDTAHTISGAKGRGSSQRAQCCTSHSAVGACTGRLGS
jgi:hypothetical protein